MTAWALLPVRSFATGKSRLGSLGAARADLARALFDHVAAAVASLPVLVATDGDDVAAAAAARGFDVIADARGCTAPTLAAIVDRGLAALAAHGASAAVVLMSDLPLVRAADVARLVSALDGADVVAAPDRDQLGTNALALRLPAALATCFGNADSYRRHLAAARAAGLRLATLDRDGLAFDLDVPADLDDLLRTAEPVPRIRREGAVRAEGSLRVVDAVERLAAVGRLLREGAKHPVERRTLGGHAPGAASRAP